MQHPNIHFFFQNSSISLSKRKKLKDYLIKMFKKERKGLNQLNCVFCSDKYLLKINQRYLLHDFYTDIITFELSDSDQTTGEIYISADRVRENAKIHKTSISQELLRVIFHGVLHLCGYNDKTKKERKIMSYKEEYYLSQWEKFYLFT